MIQHRASQGLGSAVPVRVSVDRTLRVKVIDACGMTCTFCHNEGTPVSADNPAPAAGSAPFGGAFNPAGPSGRVSIYLARNGARFAAAPMHPDEGFRAALEQLQEALGFTEVHLTGGEPTLHPKLAQLVALAGNSGYRVSVTSNGENGARILPGCVRAGLQRVNFSIFGTDSGELAEVQNEKFRRASLAVAKIEALDESIRVALDLGLSTRANVVLPDGSHVRRVHRLLERYSPCLSVRVLSSLSDGEESLDAIDTLLAELGATPHEVHLIAGTSGFRISYRLPNGGVLVVKHIRPLRLPETCAGCRFNNETDCHEGYYGVRLYRDRAGTFHVGVCIQRMDLCLPMEEFVRSGLCEGIRALRDQEFHDLRA
ncbi:radical SAM protein [Streptomyces sp. SBT349]|uniref:radical SAM protein n=1 Tax=Streptomyces sp. SBT349 TaxID=1580539 RepID=UPI00066D7B86|nr:radical SAM protein [Streptomyces sp. SBT349]